MSPLYQVPRTTGCQPVFKWGEGGLKHLSLDSLRLDADQTCQVALGEEEGVLVILGGKATVHVQARVGGSSQWQGVGTRPDPFSGSPAAVYLPRKARVEIAAESTLQAAIAKTPCDVDLSPALISPEDVKVVSAGIANWRRDVRLIVPPGSPLSQRLIVGETLNPPGNWSGIPPHKHDQITEGENILEEFYFFQVRPPDSFGIQMVYGQSHPGQDQTEAGHQAQAHVIGDGDVAVFLNGYHPTVAAPGTTVFYLWALAGDDKAYKIGIDPRFGWVSQAEAVIKESMHT